MSEQTTTQQIRTGDTVRHKPTGETWLVACVDGDRLYWMGWPPGSVDVADCELVRACSDERHISLLLELASRTRDTDHRHVVARRQIRELAGVKEFSDYGVAHAVSEAMSGRDKEIQRLSAEVIELRQELDHLRPIYREAAKRACGECGQLMRETPLRDDDDCNGPCDVCEDMYEAIGRAVAFYHRRDGGDRSDQ